jgi:hypothetical protein
MILHCRVLGQVAFVFAAGMCRTATGQDSDQLPRPNGLKSTEHLTAKERAEVGAAAATGGSNPIWLAIATPSQVQPAS